MWAIYSIGQTHVEDTCNELINSFQGCSVQQRDSCAGVDGLAQDLQVHYLQPDHDSANHHTF